MADYSWGESTLQTAWAGGLEGDPYQGYENDLRAARQELAGGGHPTYLPNVLPPNSSWWDGFDRTTGGNINVLGAASDPRASVDWSGGQAMGFVQDFQGPATATASQRIDLGAPVVDPYGDAYLGDMSLDYQPDVQQPDPWLRDGLT